MKKVEKTMKQVKRVSPYGELYWIAPEERDRYIYVYKVDFEEEGFKPPTAWFTLTCFGDRLYYRARDRATAQRLCDEFHGRKGLFTVVSDKVVQIR